MVSHGFLIRTQPLIFGDGSGHHSNRIIDSSGQITLAGPVLEKSEHIHLHSGVPLIFVGTEVELKAKNPGQAKDL